MRSAHKVKSSKEIQGHRAVGSGWAPKGHSELQLTQGQEPRTTEFCSPSCHVQEEGRNSCSLASLPGGGSKVGESLPCKKLRTGQTDIQGVA